MAAFLKWGAKPGERANPVHLVDAYGGIFGGSDAFGRIRVSEPTTLFDSKQIHNNQPLFWDDQEISGSGTTSTHSRARASSTLAVTASTAGNRMRRTRQRFNYQPGKSLLVLMTGILTNSEGAAGTEHKMGYYDDANGIYVKYADGNVSIIKRSSVSGTPVEEEVFQDDWNVDTMRGEDTSGVSIDFTKSHIFFIDLEWLGVGTVRCGFVVDGQVYLVHTFKHANIINSVYMSTPNLPLTYEISSNGANDAASMECICSSVLSEGGLEPLGALHYATTGSTAISLPTAGETYALLNIRLKSDFQDEATQMIKSSFLATGTEQYEWILYFDPTIAGTLTWNSADDNSSVEFAVGDSTNTLTNGSPITGGFLSSSQQSAGTFSSDLNNALRLGSRINGVSDIISLAIRPVTSTINIHASLTWREFK